MTDARLKRRRPQPGRPLMKTLTYPRTSGPRNRKPRGGLGVEGLDADAVDEDDLHVPRSKKINKTAHAQRA